MKTLGWIGLGNMGTPMAINLLKKDYSITYLQRNPKDVSTTEQFEAKPTQDLKEVIQNGEVIFLTLPNDAICREVFQQIITYPIKGKTFINSSTISPQAAVEFNMLLKSFEAIYLDAPVSGSVKPAQDGTLLYLIGADNAQIYQDCIEFFEILGSKHYYLGAVGMGSKAKLAINYYMSVVVDGFAQTVNFASQQGISKAIMTQIVNDSACGSAMTQIKTPGVLKDHYPVAFPLKFMLKDILLAQAQGLDTPLLKAVSDDYQKAADLGLGDLDLMAVIRAIK
ncbi:NAD(P)-dependent oxidoreductase [Myroides sp. LJL115]